MKKRKLLIAGIITISVCGIIIFCAVYKSYQREKREQQERMEAMHRQELKHITFVTSGKVVFEDEFTLEFDTKYVIMQVALYNECIDRGVQKGEKISGYMEVQEEFDDYMSGKRTLEECKAINALSDFNKAECYRDYENAELGIMYDYYDYTSSVREELKRIKRTKENEYLSFTECSNDEVEAAAETAAKQWCDYMEGK